MASLLLAVAPVSLMGASALTLTGCADDAGGAALAADETGDDAEHDEVAGATQALRREQQGPDGTGAGAGSPVIVVIGSSTSAGVGASSFQNQWVERYRAYLKQSFPNFQLVNLAQGGFTTYEVQASNYQPPANRPWPNTGKNISYALSLNPGAIIINLPTNDAQGYYSLEEQMANFERLASQAAAQGVQVWVSTSQPRNFSDSKQRDALMRTRDAIRARFGDHTLDFWNGIANGDGTINSQYDSGDGTHLNDNGHKVLADRVQWAKIPYAVRGW